MTSSTHLKLAIYLRKSSEESDKQATSLANQWRAIQPRLENLRANYEITLVSVPEKFSNAEIPQAWTEQKSAMRAGKRPVFDALVAKIQVKQVNAILVFDETRISRNSQESGCIGDFLAYGELKLVATKDTIYQPENSTQLLMLTLKSVTGQVDNMNRREYTITGSSGKAEKGGWPNYAPLGYRNKPIINPESGKVTSSEIEFDPKRASKLRRVFEEFAKGTHSIDSIVQFARKLGLTSRAFSGDHRQMPERPITRTTLAHALRNSFYAGQIRYGSIRRDGTHEPLVDVITWAKVQSILDGRGRGKAKVTTKLANTFPYRRLIKAEDGGVLTAERIYGITLKCCGKQHKSRKLISRCPSCGRSLPINDADFLEQSVTEYTYLKPPRTSKSKGYWKQKEVDQLIASKLAAVNFDDETLSLLIAISHEQHGKESSDLHADETQLKKCVTELQQQLDGVIDLQIAARDNPDRLARLETAEKKYERDLTSARAKLSELQQNQQSVNSFASDLKKVRTLINTLKTRLSEQNATVKRQLAENLFSYRKVEGNQLIFKLNAPFCYLENDEHSTWRGILHSIRFCFEEDRALDFPDIRPILA